MDDNEAALVKRAAAGDEEAFAMLVETHKGVVYNVALKILGDAHDAEDAFQETFMSAFKGLSRFRSESRFSTWLYSIAVNSCRQTLLRRRRAAEELPESLTLAGKSEPEAARTMREAVALLPEEFRTAIVLHSMMGYTYEEAGGIMGVPAGTVKTRVHRGKIALREILGDGE